MPSGQLTCIPDQFRKCSISPWLALKSSLQLRLEISRNFREFPSGGQLWGKSDSRSVCMRMRVEQSSGMHVKWGDGGDLIVTESTGGFYNLTSHPVRSLLHCTSRVSPSWLEWGMMDKRDESYPSNRRCSFALLDQKIEDFHFKFDCSHVSPFGRGCPHIRLPSHSKEKFP